MAVAVFDVGKTNLKLVVIDAEGRVRAQRSTPNVGVPGPPYLHVDLAAVESWLLASPRRARRRASDRGHRHHGARLGRRAGRRDGPVMPMIDYEATPPDWLDAAYAGVMPPFPERGSRLLGGASHLGRQLFWLSRGWPDALARRGLSCPCRNTGLGGCRA